MRNTHMPFIAESGDDRIELCCRKINNCWKLHRKSGNKWVRLATGREEDAVECAPTAEFINGKWHISFIALGAQGNRLARLYEMIDDNVQEVSSPAAVGFVRSDLKVYSAEMEKFVVEYSPNKKKMIACPDWNELLRISYDPVYPDHLLISCRYKGRLSSWLYDMHTGKLFDIEADGTAAYKCAFFQGTCYYARQTGEGFEDREIVETLDYKITPLNENILTVSWER